MMGAMRAILVTLYQENRQEGPCLLADGLGQSLKGLEERKQHATGVEGAHVAFPSQVYKTSAPGLTGIGGGLTHAHFAVRETKAERDVKLPAQVTKAGESVRMSFLVSLVQHSSPFTQPHGGEEGDEGRVFRRASRKALRSEVY